MLNIKIIGVDAGGNLQFKVNGRHSNNGDGTAMKNWSVRWKVKRGIAVQSITDIQKKPSSTDIFTHHPPRSHNPRVWKATVDSTVQDNDQYHYSILWEDTNGTGHTQDPIISINPSTSFLDVNSLILVAASITLAFFTLQFLRKKKNIR